MSFRTFRDIFPTTMGGTRFVASAIMAVAVSLCAGNAQADCYTYDTKNGTVNLGAETQINSTDRFIIFQGTVNLNEGASIKCGGNNAGSCNFIGIDRGAGSALNINGGTFWCATSNGAGYLAVGNKDNGVSSTLSLNSGTLRVDTQLRSSTQWNGLSGAKSSGTIVINVGEAIVKQFVLGASSANSGTSTLYLSFDGNDALVYSAAAGGADTPAETSYSRLVFADTAGAFTVGGDGLTLSYDISDLSAAAQTITAPITFANGNRSAYVAEGGKLTLSGGTTAQALLKEGKGTLVLGNATMPTTLVPTEGTIDFGGNTYTGTLNLDGRLFDGERIVLTNGTYNSAGNFKGSTVVLADGFTMNTSGRIAMGYVRNNEASVHDTTLVIDGGTLKVQGNNGNNCNFIGVDRSGTFILELKRGVFEDTGWLRIAAGGWIKTGIVRVSGGTFSVANDVTMGTVFNGTDGNCGYGTFVQSGGSVRANKYISIGWSNGSVGLYYMSGGDFFISANRANLGSELAVKMGLGDISGGTATTAKGLNVAHASGSTAKLSLRGSGTLVTADIIGDQGASTVEFDGGTLVANASNAAFIKGIKNVVFGESGVTLNTAGYNLGITNCVLTATPGATAIRLTGGGSLDFTNTRLEFADELTGSFVFARAMGDSTFTSAPSLSDGIRGFNVKLSADGKTINVRQYGFSIFVR